MVHGFPPRKGIQDTVLVDGQWYTSVYIQNDLCTIEDVPFLLHNSMPAFDGELSLQTRIAIAFLHNILCVLLANVFTMRQLGLSISLGRSFNIHVQAFRLAACVIHLTMLLQYTFGCRHESLLGLQLC